MKLYLSPMACSLAPHIALNEAGLAFERIDVDIPTRKTAAGDDFTQINPKGYVPALVFDDGQVLTENVAILDWIAQQAPAMIPAGKLGRIRMLEMLAFMTTEIHKPFLAFMFMPGDEARDINRHVLVERFAYLATQLRGDYLLGDSFSVADAYLFVMLSWARQHKLAIAPTLLAYHDRVAARPVVASTLRAEGIA